VIPGTLSFSSEKDAERRAAMADIETYVDEMVMKFITGREPIENWDTYVAKVKEMGIENVIGIYQEALDAWNS
jgi:putative aldouronate transport system substrate-binding protein